MKHPRPAPHRLIDALAFANAGNFSEFQALLEASAMPTPARPAPTRITPRQAVIVPLRHAGAH